jgi:dipeptidyl-peptidase-4
MPRVRRFACLIARLIVPVFLLFGCVPEVLAQAQSQSSTQPATQAESQPTTQPETQPATQPVAERKPLTWDKVYGRDRVDFDGSYARGMRWLADGEHYLHQREGELMRVDVLSDEAEPAYDREALEAALKAQGDFDERAARRSARRPDSWTADRDAALIDRDRNLYLYRFSTNELRKLTRDTKPRRLVDLSPNGGGVSFVRDNNLYTIDTRTGKQRQLTHDGSDTLLNGVLDWVYQEEIFGRGRWRASWWSPDGEYLAYFRLDESNVPVYTLVDYMPHYSTVEQTRYPKAGEPNAAIRLGIARRKTGRTVWVDLAKYEGTDILIVRVSWSPAGRLLFSVQDREQRWLELNEADPKTGRMRTLIREVSPAWVENVAHPFWLDDGSFLWLSERDGYRHIYHYSCDGELLRRVTSGDWPVGEICGYDEQAGLVYFTGYREIVLESHAYRVPLEGGPIERLTEPGYSHDVDFDPTLRLFFDTFSDCATPRKVYLRHADGSLARVISENDEVKALDEYVWSVPEVFQIPNRNGFPINVRMIRPPDFDPTRKYPVLCPVYGGPGAQGVRNRWAGSGQLFHQYLAQQGYIIWRPDPYSCTGSVAVATWQAYCRLGDNELADVEDSLRWLIDQGYADPQRIGITGFSYGGYLAAYALTHSDMFKVGIAGALLSDWRNYDSVYAERYMQTPEHDPDGYDLAGIANAAAHLHGRLLIVHGLRDDNVHFQNSAQLIDALEQENRMFDLMIYPRDRHGIGRGDKHFRELQRNYILDNL